MISGGTKPPRPPGRAHQAGDSADARRIGHPGDQREEGGAAAPGHRQEGHRADVRARGSWTRPRHRRRPRRATDEHRDGPNLSESQPPTGRIRTATTTKPAIRFAASAGEVVGGLEVGRGRRRRRRSHRRRRRRGCASCQVIGSRAFATRRVISEVSHGAAGVPHDQPGRDGVDRECRRGDQERRLLADVLVELDGGQRADRGAAHARAEDADGQAPTLRGTRR